MPYALIVFGLLLLVASVRNTQGQLFNLLKSDFTGPHNFVYWFIAIMAIGSIGYIDKLKPISNAFLILVVVILFLSNRGFFAQFQSQIHSSDTAQLNNGGFNPIGFGGLSSGLAIPTLPTLPTFSF